MSSIGLNSTYQETRGQTMESIASRLIPVRDILSTFIDAHLYVCGIRNPQKILRKVNSNPQFSLCLFRAFWSAFYVGCFANRFLGPVLVVQMIIYWSIVFTPSFVVDVRHCRSFGCGCCLSACYFSASF